jgi:hypothetical protein
MKHYVPEVTAIISEDDLQATEQGYTPFMPQTTYPE